MEEGVAAAVVKRAEQLPGAARGLLGVPALAGLVEQLRGAPGQIRGHRLAADSDLDPGQGDLGIAPLSLAQELLRLEQVTRDIAVQPGDPQVLLERSAAAFGSCCAPGSYRLRRRPPDSA